MKIFNKKSIFCILLLIVLSSHTFSAVVSDSDGSAFVNKAEFEELKSELNSQIDNYNNSIDNKIDGAIASYIAGLVKNAVTVKSNIEALDYPLTIINKLKVIETVTTKDTNLASQEPLWNLSYVMFGGGSRGTHFAAHQTTTGVNPGINAVVNTQLDKLENIHIDKIEKYLNGTKNGTDNFKVNDICNKPKLTIKTGFLVENLEGYQIVDDKDAAAAAASDKGVFSDIVMDQKEIVNRAPGSSTTATVRGSLLANYEALWQTKDFSSGAKSPYINLVHYANNPYSHLGHSDYVGKAEYYSYFTNTSSTVWEGLSGIGSFNASTLWTSTYTYSNSNLDRIYNCGDSTLGSHFAPVTYNNNLYFTNKRANRIYTPSVGRVNWQGRDNTPGNPYGIYGVLSAGENLENEKENSTGTRPWYNKSLISQTRLIYDFKDEDGNVYANHRMVNGIPIFKVPKNDVLGLQVELNITSQKSSYQSNSKYVIFSEKPITTQSYSANVENNADYIKIINSTPTANLRKAKLAEGKNILKLGDFYKGTMIYMKILWNDTDEEYITIDKPIITYTPE